VVCGGAKDVTRYVAMMLPIENFAVIDAMSLLTDVVLGRLGTAATVKVCSRASRELGFLLLVCLWATFIALTVCGSRFTIGMLNELRLIDV